MMKRVPALMQQRLHVPMNTRRIHENKRLPRFLQRHEISAGLFSLAALQIQIPMLPKLIKIRRQ